MQEDVHKVSIRFLRKIREKEWYARLVKGALHHTKEGIIFYRNDRVHTKLSPSPNRAKALFEPIYKRFQQSQLNRVLKNAGLLFTRMNDARRQKVLKVMAVVLVAFGGSLVYFLFFNSGLTLSPDPANQAGRVIVLNDSVHAIHDVTFSYVVQGKLVGSQTFDVLLPRESKLIDLDTHFQDGPSYTVYVSAPYHLSRQLTIQTGSPANTTPALSITFEVPEIATQNNPVSIQLSGRNLDPIAGVVRVAWEWDSPSFGENPPIEEWGLPPNGESALTISSTPLSSGDDLSFKIKVFTPSTVLVERSYTLNVLPGPDANTTMDANQSTLGMNASDV
jgi:hypothetical protein